MNSRERIKRTLEFQPVDRVPRDLWALLGVVRLRTDEYAELRKQYPPDMTYAGSIYGKSLRARGTPGAVGVYVDDWGCAMQVAEPGVVGEVKEALLDDDDAVAKYQPPWEMLREADLTRVNANCAASDLWLRGATHVRPFERAQFLRGTEKLMLDMAYGSREFDVLIQRLHEFFLEEIALWCQTDVDCISFMDDWGTQISMLISPDMWRALFKPLYKQYCELIHAGGKKVFFHSDGYITPIIEDLIEIGVDALNSQLFCQDIEEIGRRFSGRITFWGEIDRQSVLPFGTPADVKAAVRRVRKALDHGHGGVIAQCEWGNNDPKENIAAVFEAWLEPYESVVE
jgi:uroporphyrinogen decarboxylase